MSSARGIREIRPGRQSSLALHRGKSCILSSVVYAEKAEIISDVEDFSKCKQKCTSTSLCKVFSGTTDRTCTLLKSRRGTIPLREANGARCPLAQRRGNACKTFPPQEICRYSCLLRPPRGIQRQMVGVDSCAVAA